MDLTLYPDPVPQALVLTAIVIGFATTALFLVVLLALRGLTSVPITSMAGSPAHERDPATSRGFAHRRSADRGRRDVFLAESRRTARSDLAAISILTQLSVAVSLLYLTSDAAPYIWPRAWAFMPWAAGRRRSASCWSSIASPPSCSTLGAVVSLSTLVYSVARWDRPGQPFHSLFQFPGRWA